MPQLLKPECLEPVLHKRSHCSENHMLSIEEQPPLDATREKPAHSHKDPMQPKIKKLIKKKEKGLKVKSEGFLYPKTKAVYLVIPVINVE